MRSLLLAALTIAPAALAAQYPPPGSYKAVVQPIGQDATIPLTLTVTPRGDSTEVGLFQGETSPVPLSAYSVLPAGFHLVIANQLFCDVVKGEAGWDGVCSDDWGGPQFTMHVPPKPEPDTTAAP
jgi:hypothetical protein